MVMAIKESGVVCAQICHPGEFKKKITIKIYTNIISLVVLCRCEIVCIA